MRVSSHARMLWGRPSAKPARLILLIGNGHTGWISRVSPISRGAVRLAMKFGAGGAAASGLDQPDVQPIADVSEMGEHVVAS